MFPALRRTASRSVPSRREGSIRKPIGDLTRACDTLRERRGVHRLHDLRHTAATKMAAADVAKSTMLAIMGHRSVRCWNGTAISTRNHLSFLKVGPRLVSAPTSKRRKRGQFRSGDSREPWKNMVRPERFEL